MCPLFDLCCSHFRTLRTALFKADFCRRHCARAERSWIITPATCRGVAPFGISAAFRHMPNSASGIFGWLRLIATDRVELAPQALRKDRLIRRTHKVLIGLLQKLLLQGGQADCQFKLGLAMLPRDAVYLGLFGRDFVVMLALGLPCSENPPGLFGVDAPSVGFPSRHHARQNRKNNTPHSKKLPTRAQKSGDHLSQPQQADPKLVFPAVHEAFDAAAARIHPLRQFIAGTAQVAAVRFLDQGGSAECARADVVRKG